jgi:tetratricopeptide (TPR) repeat protein
MKTKSVYLILLISLFGCDQSNSQHELVSEPHEQTESSNYHDIDFYSPEYGEYPVLDSANDLMHDGFYAEAIPQYGRAEKVLGFHPDIYINRGFCFSRLKKYSDAIANNTSLIQYDSLFYPAYMNRGMNYFDSGKFDLALIDFKYSIYLAPSRPESYVNTGLAFVEMDLLDSACHYFHVAKSIDTQDEHQQIDRHIQEHCTEWNGLLETPRQ